MDIDDVLHRLAVRKLDVVEETAAQEGVGQFLFIVRSNDNDRAFFCLDALLRFVNVEAHPVEFLKQIVREFDIGLVDFVDQQNGQFGRGEGFPQLALLDVIADVVDAFFAQLAIAQARHRVIFIKALLRLGAGLDIPFDQRSIQRLGNLMRQHGFAGSRLALNQQRAAQSHRCVDRHFQIIGGDVIAGAFKTLRLIGHGFSYETELG